MEKWKSAQLLANTPAMRCRMSPLQWTIFRAHIFFAMTKMIAYSSLFNHEWLISVRISQKIRNIYQLTAIGPRFETKDPVLGVNTLDQNPKCVKNNDTHYEKSLMQYIEKVSAHVQDRSLKHTVVLNELTNILCSN